jgi:hypothetical protein
VGRRSHNSHWDSGKRGEASSLGDRKIALCGDDYFMATYVTEEGRVTCPKCSAILSQRKLDAWNADPANKKLAIERVIDPKAYTKGSFGGHRYAYKALYGGEHVGYIVMDGGYANTHWLLRIIGLEEKTDTEKLGHGISDGDLKELDGEKVGRFDHDPYEFNCKERALLRVPGLFEKKKLRTTAQTIKDRTEWRARLARREAEQEAAENAAAAERTEALAGLREIRGINSLSDQARAGLEYAIRKLTPKGDAE